MLFFVPNQRIQQYGEQLLKAAAVQRQSLTKDSQTTQQMQSNLEDVAKKCHAILAEVRSRIDLSLKLQKIAKDTKATLEMWRSPLTSMTRSSIEYGVGSCNSRSLVNVVICTNLAKNLLCTQTHSQICILRHDNKYSYLF